MKILHVITGLNSGGAEKMLVDIVLEMKKKGVISEVAVLTKKDDFFSEQLILHGVKVYWGPRKKVYSLKNIHFIRSILKDYQYDVIHTHLYGSQLFTPIAMMSLFSPTKLVTTEHSTHNKRRDNRLFFLLDRWMYKKYDKIIAISEGTQKNLNIYLSETLTKTIVVENGIDLSEFKQAVAVNVEELDKRVYKNEKIILMVAAMREQKDHETLIRASKLLPKDYRVVFVGDGQRYNEVREYAQKNGRKEIIFLGRRNDVPTIMASADVFVLSSKWEGFGLVVVEATATGLPVVASDVVGLKEVVREVGGYLFEQGNEFDLAEKIIKTVQMKKAIREFPNLDRFSISRTVSNYIKVYDEILKENKTKKKRIYERE